MTDRFIVRMKTNKPRTFELVDTQTGSVRRTSQSKHTLDIEAEKANKLFAEMERQKQEREGSA